MSGEPPLPLTHNCTRCIRRQFSRRSPRTRGTRRCHPETPGQPPQRIWHRPLLRRTKIGIAWPPVGAASYLVRDSEAAPSTLGIAAIVATRCWCKPRRAQSVASLGLGHCRRRLRTPPAMRSFKSGSCPSRTRITPRTSESGMRYCRRLSVRIRLLSTTMRPSRAMWRMPSCSTDRRTHRWQLSPVSTRMLRTLRSSTMAMLRRNTTGSMKPTRCHSWAMVMVARSRITSRSTSRTMRRTTRRRMSINSRRRRSS
mmetsp:Transcript_89215/g.257238  ORF Transcript_89215/g.257238 Transcript_89215/m.257238 type:complete len:255 (-) Transcript_89215:1077-1841(-)